MPPQRCFPLVFINCSDSDVKVSVGFSSDTTKNTEFTTVHMKDSLIFRCAIRETMNELFRFNVNQDKIIKKKSYYARDLKIRHFKVYYCNDFK